MTVDNVAPDGASTVLTNGAFSVSNRAIDMSLSDYAEDGSLLVAHHCLSHERKLPVPAGVPPPIDVDLVPTDAMLVIGHRPLVYVHAGSTPKYPSVVPDLIRAHARRQDLVLDPHRPSYLSFRAIGDPA